MVQQRSACPVAPASLPSLRGACVTCIVGTVGQDGSAYMGADSCGSNGWTWQEVQNRKLFRLTEEVQGVDMLVGCTGTFRLIDVLTHELTLPPRRPSQTPDAWMRSSFVPEVRQALSSAGHLKSESGVVEMGGGPFLAAYAGGLYEVQCELSVLTIASVGHAVGSGCAAARGSLWTTREWTDQERRVRAALEAAEAVVATVRGPFVVERLDGSTTGAAPTTTPAPTDTKCHPEGGG